MPLTCYLYNEEKTVESIDEGARGCTQGTSDRRMRMVGGRGRGRSAPVCVSGTLPSVNTNL